MDGRVRCAFQKPPLQAVRKEEGVCWGGGRGQSGGAGALRAPRKRPQEVERQTMGKAHHKPQDKWSGVMPGFQCGDQVSN